MSVRFYNVQDVKDEDLKVAVIVCTHNGKLVMCKHKERDTWECPGGHREEGETILEAAKRELHEETGAKEFTIKPVCVYKITRYAMLYYAEVTEFGELPESEIECIEFFDALPENLTYPSIHPDLHAKAMDFIMKESRPLGKMVTVTVDRPLGTYHPKHPDIYYPVNYGFIEGIIAQDGEEQDAYILGVNEPVKTFTGKVIAVIHRNDDVEEKWIVCPKNKTFSKEEIMKQVEFQEQYFDSYVIM